MSLVKILTDYSSHIVAYGSSGLGKSVHTRGLTELLYADPYNCKIMDLYDDGRLENCFIYFPNPDERMYHLFAEWIGRSFSWLPQGYPTECFIPAFHKIPPKLPSIFKPFTIAFEDLTLTEFKILLGKLSPPQSELITLIWNHVKSKPTFEHFIQVTQDFISDSKIKVNRSIINICDDRLGLSILQRLDTLNRLGILSDKKNPLNLDLRKIMRDRDTISCFSFAFLDNQNTKHLLLGYLFRKIFSLRLDRVTSGYSQYPPLALIHRELQNSAPARGKKSSYAYDGQSLSLEFIKKIIAEPRDVKIRLVADSQDPMKIDSDVRKGFTTRFIFQLDRAVLDALTQQFWLDPKTYVGIQYLDIGQFAIKTRPQSFNVFNKRGIQFPCMYPPPKSWCKTPDDLFFKTWKSQGGDFISWKFVKPKSIIHIKTLSRDEKEATNLKLESLYDHYGQVVKIVIADNPGVSVSDIIKNPLISQLGWDTFKVYRIVDRLANTDPPEILRKRKGRSWECYPISSSPPSDISPQSS